MNLRSHVIMTGWLKVLANDLSYAVQYQANRGHFLYGFVDFGKKL
jgi:hypothetical protein